MSDFVLHFSRGEINQKLIDTRKLHVGRGYIHVSRKSYPSVDIRPYIAYRKHYIKFKTIDTHIEFSKYYSKNIYLDYEDVEDNNLIDILYWDSVLKKWILKLKEHPTKPSVTIKIIIKYLNPNTGQIEKIPTRFWCLTYQGNIKFLNTVPPKEKHCISLLKYIYSISIENNAHIKIQLFNEHNFVLPKLYVEYYSNKNKNTRIKSVKYLTPPYNQGLTRKKWHKPQQINFNKSENYYLINYNGKSSWRMRFKSDKFFSEWVYFYIDRRRHKIFIQ